MHDRIPHHKVVVVLCASIIISKNKTSIMDLCLLSLHNNMNQELLEKYICIEVATMKSVDSAARPSYCLKNFVSVSYVQQKNCLKSTSIIKVATM